MGQLTWHKFSSFERLWDSHLEKRLFLSFISDHCTLGCPNSLMATSKILVFSIFLALLFSRITADPPLPNDGASASAPEVAGSSLKLKLELLQLKVSLLGDHFLIFILMYFLGLFAFWENVRSEKNKNQLQNFEFYAWLLQS